MEVAGNGQTAGVKVNRLTPSLKYLSTNAQSVRSKQEELEIFIRLNNYDITAITETWWDSSHGWNAVMEALLLRKDRTAR